MERRKHSTAGSLSPPSIPSPPPPIDISTLGRKMPPMPPIPSLIPNGGATHGHLHSFDLNRPIANELSSEITRYLMIFSIFLVFLLLYNNMCPYVYLNLKIKRPKTILAPFLKLYRFSIREILSFRYKTLLYIYRNILKLIEYSMYL